MNLNSLSQLEIGNYIVGIAIGVIVFVWIRQILWITKDISARTDNLGLQILSIIISVILLPVSGLMIYFLLRPTHYKYDKNGRKEALALQTVECGFCNGIVLTEFDYCIFCGEEIKTKCKECKNEYPLNWEYCNKCGAPNVASLEE